MEYRVLGVDEIIVGERQRYAETEEATKEPGESLEELAESIKRLGLINPISVDKDNNLLCGERRLSGVKLLGWETVPVRVFADVDEARKAEFELAENLYRRNFTARERLLLEDRIYEHQAKIDREWSNHKQAKLRGVDSSTIDRRLMLASVVKAEEELREYGLDLTDCKTENDIDKAHKKWQKEIELKIRRLDLTPEEKEAYRWAEDHYRVGDAIEGLLTVEPESVDFVEVDPPYAVRLDERKDSRNEVSNTKDYIEWTRQQYTENLRQVAKACFNAMKPDTFGVFWYATRHHQLTLDILLNAGFSVNPVNALWYKQNSTGQADTPEVAFGSVHEPFFLVRKRNPKFRVGKAGRPNVFAFDVVPHSKKRHPTQKPVELMTEILETCCLPRAKVLVPFLGSGVTLIAAYMLEEMTAFGWDLSEENREKFLNAVVEQFQPEVPEIPAQVGDEL